MQRLTRLERLRKRRDRLIRILHRRAASLGDWLASRVTSALTMQLPGLPSRHAQQPTLGPLASWFLVRIVASCRGGPSYVLGALLGMPRRLLAPRVTYAIVAINLAIFILADRFAWPMDVESLFRAGAVRHTSLEDGEWWLRSERLEAASCRIESIVARADRLRPLEARVLAYCATIRRRLGDTLGARRLLESAQSGLGADVHHELARWQAWDGPRDDLGALINLERSSSSSRAPRNR